MKGKGKLELISKEGKPIVEINFTNYHPDHDGINIYLREAVNSWKKNYEGSTVKVHYEKIE